MDKKVLGNIICGLSVIGGLYLGIYWCFIGGIINVIDGFACDPVNSFLIGCGFFRTAVAGIVGWSTFIIGFFVGLCYIDKGTAGSR